METSKIQSWKLIEAALPYRAGDVRTAPGLVLVMLDAEHYLGDPKYRKQRSAGAPAIRNLWAFDPSGRKIWEAEMPEPTDYYHEIASVDPLTVRSFSGYTSVLDPGDGRILRRTYDK